MSTIFQNADSGARLVQIVNEVADTDAEFVLCRDGQAVAVIVGFERFEEMRRAVRRDGHGTGVKR